MTTAAATKTPSYEQVRAALERIAENDADTANDLRDALNRNRNNAAEYTRLSLETLQIAKEWEQVVKEESPVTEPKPKKVKTKPIKRQRQTIPDAEPHLWTAEQLARLETPLYRVIAFGLWLFVLAGTVLALLPDQWGWSWQLALYIAVALSWQGFLTLAQFILCHNPRNRLYWLALGASILPAFVGWRPVIAVPLIETVTGLEEEALSTGDLNAMLWALGLNIGLLIVLAAADIIPERIFIKK